MVFGRFLAASIKVRRGRDINVPCYAPFVKGSDVPDARERIQKLLVTGDNRLKQGVDPAIAALKRKRVLMPAIRRHTLVIRCRPANCAAMAVALIAENLSR